ncbi:RloB family protein [Sphingobacterium hungaricum]|uniref:RloB-like protein n=1 Tax=Sphingobacterium hungaricum TaxID=2082723 RepID=A0A928V2H7_9SPHI|nr:RloB family protein [Sphingobacterium hungaricum]MBE8715322.1 RloB-like protein [Sphingobacterium hungaricum]
MARKVKFSDAKREKFSRIDQRRKRDTRNMRQYFLIVCEGAETEPNYFEGLKDDLPKGTLTTHQIEVQGTGRNTQSLLDEAMRLRAWMQKYSTRKVDRLWIVFDKDSFTAQDFNGAIQRCHNEGIGCAWSNEAFELWYLLHFDYFENGMGRDVYKKMIEDRLKSSLGNSFRYRKNSPNMYAILRKFGSLEVAIRNAKRLAKKYEGDRDYSSQNPCTMVFALIEELINLDS